jgi:hypothetical protein
MLFTLNNLLDKSSARGAIANSAPGTSFMAQRPDTTGDPQNETEMVTATTRRGIS